jgi:hypothetical protein
MKRNVELQSVHLRRAWKLAESLIASLNEGQLVWAPEGKWSAAGLIEHLSLGFLVTTKAARMVLRQGGPDLPKTTLRQRWLAFRVIQLGHYPGRVVAPKMVWPRGLSPQDAMRAFTVNLLEMDQLLHQCEARFGSSIKLLSHPYLGPLSSSQWRKFHLFHVRRHMRQVKRLCRQMMEARSASAIPV